VLYEHCAPPLKNDEKCTEILRNSVEKLYGPEFVAHSKRAMGSEDFAFFSELRPSVFVFLGVQSPEGTVAAMHNDRFGFDDSVLKRGAALRVQYALDYLAQ